MKVYFLAFKLLLLFFVALQTSALAQNLGVDNYVITKFGLNEGLPQSSVNDIIQTKDGYIWLATFGGLVRFDGNSFTTFNRSNSEGFGSDRILHLYEGRSGIIWLSTERGFTTYKDGIFQTFPLKDVGAINAPQRVVQDAKSRTWGLVDGIPYFFNEGTITKKEIIKNDNLINRALSNKDGVLVAYQKKVLHTLGDSLVLIRDFDSIIESEISGVIEFPKNSGTIYIATARNGVYRYENEQLFSFKESGGFSSDFIKRLSIDTDSTLWVITYNGISKFNGERFEIFDPIKADYEINFTKIFKDNEDSYWLGTLGEGLFSAKPSIIKTLSKEEGLENDIMLSLSQLKDGRKLFSTNCGGVYEWDQGKLSYSTVNTHLPNLCVWSIFQDSKNRIWFGAEELYQINSMDLSVKGEKIDAKYGFNGHVIHSIMEDTKGNIWIGAIDGLFKYDEKEFQHFTTNDGLSSSNVRTIYEDKSGALWVGTISGLNKIEDGKITVVSLQPESIKNTENEPYVRAIYEGENGAFWIGSYGNGLFRLKGNEICSITTDDGLFDDIVSHLVKDENGNFWMGSNRGIFRLPIASAVSFCEGDTETVQSYSYGDQDGMISVETNGGFQPSTIQDSLGNIYFPTVGGVAIVSTNNIEVNNIQPPVYIQKIRGSKFDLPLANSVELSHDDSFLEIDYTAINFSKPEKIKFKYKLDGFSDNWIEVGNRRQALYTKIPPGDYTFTVLSSNSDGVWNTNGASIDIVVTPPFWQTTWFMGISIGLCIAVGFVFFKTRTNILKAENEKQKRFAEQLIASQENERRRIASELHDGLGQQILVIKNRAELAQNQVNNPQELSEQLTEIMNSAVSSIQDVRNISHALRPIHLEKFGLTDAISDLCSKLQQISKIEWSYHIDDVAQIIPKEKEINFYRVVQEAVNNILKHSEASEASVIVRVNRNMINTVIWDNGIGFRINDRKFAEGLGYLSMKERVETLGGTLLVESIPDEGTSLKFQLKKNITSG